jgi:enamine deaminase RidA (YjgF/YER057c/UK114 family)
MSADAKIVELGLELPPAPAPMGVYKPIVITGNLAYLSGHGPVQSDGTLMTGRVGDDLDLDAGYQSARQVGLTMLATVNCTPDFPDHPKVINGCSELFAQVWGEENGVGARSAVGMGSLPGNISTEIEAIFEID